MKNLTEDQITQSLPHLKEAFKHLFAMWNSLSEIESICDTEIDTDSIMNSTLATCEEHELTDEVLKDFFIKL